MSVITIKLYFEYVTGVGVDYDFGPYSVTFPAGATSVPFDVLINYDNVLEKNETFRLIIEKSLHNGINRGRDNHRTVVIILDTTGN